MSMARKTAKGFIFLCIGFACVMLLLSALWASDANAQARRTASEGIQWTLEAQGGDFTAVDMVSNNFGWAMALHGNKYQFYAFNGSGWSQTATAFAGSRTLGQMNDFVLTDANTGWAVGRYSDPQEGTNGRIWKLDNGNWVTLPITPANSLSRIRKKESGSAWTYSFRDVYYFDGSEWHEVINGGTPAIQAVDGLADGSRYWTAISIGGSVTPLLLDSKAGSKPYSLTNDINDIHMLSATGGWAVGAGGYVLHFDGDTWSSVNTPATISDTLTRVEMTSATSGFVLGYTPDNRDFVMRYSGNAWTRTFFNSPSRLVDMSLTNDTSGWIVGRNGGATQWNGSAWIDGSSTINPPPAARNLLDIEIISSTLAIAAAGSDILMYDGVRWSPYRLAERNVEIRAVDVLSSTVGMAVGSSEDVASYDFYYGSDYHFTAWNFDGQNWNKTFHEIDWCGANELLDVSMASPNYIWAGGNIDCNEGNGRMYQFDGTQWEEDVPSATSEAWPERLELISETDGWGIWAFYDWNSSSYSWYNNLRHFNGTLWEFVTLSLGDCQKIYNVEILASDDIWATASYRAGCNGFSPSQITPLLLHYDGNSWESQPTPDNVLLFDMHFVNSNDVWAVGAGGVILHFDGSSWRQVPSPVNVNLTKIVMLDSTFGRILGDEGTILRSVLSDNNLYLPAVVR